MVASLLPKAALALFLGAVGVLAQGPVNLVDTTVFPSISPSPDLVWHDCYNGTFKCARMEVPAEINDIHDIKKVKHTKCGIKPEHTVQLAIVKLPYVPSGPDAPPHQGAVHVSLGGWSQSTTNFLVRFGPLYAPVFLGYDLIAIDYRGFGWSTPTFNCFASEEERLAWAQSEPPLLGASDEAISAREMRAEEFGDKCKKNGEAVGKYMGTYPAAVDHYAVMKADNRTKMGFWGVSSGTHLAQTIAMLYPEAVDKFFLDSIVPSDLAYTVTTAQPLVIQDSKKALDAFFYTCLEAGPVNCSFVGTSTTTDELRARFEAVDEKLKTTPIPVLGSPIPFDWSLFRRFLSISLHTAPYFPVLGGVLAEAEVGGAFGWIPYAMFNVTLVPPAPRSPPQDDSAPVEGILTGVCLDEAHHLHSTSQFEAYWETMKDAGPTAPIFADWRLVCSKWQIEPVNKISPHLLEKSVATSGQIVIFNNIADPANSIAGAETVAARFSPSVIVKNIAVSHTSFTASSPCLFSTLFQLFVLGLVPPPGSICEGIDPSLAPFGIQLPSTF